MLDRSISAIVFSTLTCIALLGCSTKYQVTGEEKTSFCKSLDWNSCHNQGMELYKQGRYFEARPVLEIALVKAKQFGPEDLRLATSLNSLADLYRAQAMYTKAEALYNQSLEIRESILGSTHPDVGITRHNLG